MLLSGSLWIAESRSYNLYIFHSAVLPFSSIKAAFTEGIKQYLQNIFTRFEQKILLKTDLVLIFQNTPRNPPYNSFVIYIAEDSKPDPLTAANTLVNFFGYRDSL